MTDMQPKAFPWGASLVAVGILLFAALVGYKGFLPVVTFKSFDLTAFSRSLTPLLVVAVLIERSLEVFFGIWREPRNRELDHKVELAAQAISRIAVPGAQMAPLAAAEVAAAEQLGTAPGRSATLRTTESGVAHAMAAPEAVARLAAVELAEAKQERAERDAETTRWAFVAGGALGVLVALSGVRLLESMIVMPPSLAWRFQMMDVVLTGGLLGGGAEGFHRIMNVLTAFLKTTEKRAEAAAPPKPAGTA